MQEVAVSRDRRARLRPRGDGNNARRRLRRWLVIEMSAPFDDRATGGEQQPVAIAQRGINDLCGRNVRKIELSGGGPAKTHLPDLSL